MFLKSTCAVFILDLTCMNILKRNEMFSARSDKPFIWVKRKWTILLIPKISNELTFLRETFFSFSTLIRVLPLRHWRMLITTYSGKESHSISLPSPLIDLVIHSEECRLPLVIYIHGILARKRSFAILHQVYS